MLDVPVTMLIRSGKSGGEGSIDTNKPIGHSD